jgi:hypothetical protein
MPVLYEVWILARAGWICAGSVQTNRPNRTLAELARQFQTAVRLEK